MTAQRILVVEDEAVSAWDERELVTSLGHIVTAVVGSGEEAVRQVEAERPDIVLMDIVLDGEMDGIEAAQKIHREHDVPVIYVTAHADEHFIQRAKLTGPFGYLIKPFDRRSLAINIDMALERHRMERKLRDLNEVLESRVRRRTETLIEANGRLRYEIAARQRLDEALMENMERFSATFEQAAVGLAHVAHDGSFLRANRKICSILGYPREELLQKNCKEITYPGDVEKTLAYIERIISGETETASLEKRYVRKDGSLVWINLTVSALRNQDGRFKYFISVIEDISERKRLAERMQQNQDTLFRVGRISTMGEMAAAIAHEINQPLTAIGNYAGGAIERLESTPAAAPALREAMQRIIDLSHRAAGIIKRLRDFAQGDSEQYRPLSLNQAVSESIALVQVQMQRREVNIRTLFSKDLPQVYGDILQIEQVIINLLLNAMEAMEQNARGERWLSLSTRGTEDDKVELKVHDRGAGLAPEVAQRLFEPFVTTKHGGMGLGLSISHTIVEAHRGRLWATSEPEGGTCFHLTLPICQ